MTPFEAVFINQTFLPQKPSAKLADLWGKEKDSTLKKSNKTGIGTWLKVQQGTSDI